MDETAFTETMDIPGSHLVAEIARLLQSGEVTRLQVKTPSGNLTLVLPLTPARERVAERWAPVAETLAHQYPVLALRVARSAELGSLSDVAAVHQVVTAGDEGRAG
jgi:hypothetical protein